MPGTFRVGLTRDFLREDGTIGWGDIGLGALDEAHDVTWEFLPEDGQELTAEQVSPYDALIVLAPRGEESTTSMRSPPSKIWTYSGSATTT